MKRIIVLFTAIIVCLLTVQAQENSRSADSANTAKIEYTDTPDPGHQRNDTNNNDFPFRFDLDSANLIPIIAIIAVFGLPALIVFIAFFFQYKNRKAKYKLAEQALAAGQPIPKEFMSIKAESNILSRGISNTFTGIGLFIFLWAITNSFNIGCIGLLVMFTGLGQIVIYHVQQKQDTNRKDTDKGSPEN